MADKLDYLTWESQRDADPVRFRESQIRGGHMRAVQRRTEPPPAWLFDMSADEFERWLERQEARRA